MLSKTQFTLQTVARIALTAAIAATLAACGAGSVKDPFIPDRVVVLGDALSAMPSATARFTVNDASINNWAEQIASSYSLTAAKIVPLAAGNANIAAVGAQATGFTFLTGDLVLVSAGYRDLIDIAEAGGTQAAMVASADAKGTAYADMIRGLVSAGAKHVVVLNMYNLAQTPYQTLAPRTTTTHPLSLMTRAFNDRLAIELQHFNKPYIGDNVRLVKAESYMISVTGNPTGNGFTDATTVVCTSTGSIGITGSTISAAGCNTSTLNPAIVSPQTYNSYVFADPVYLTPAAHRGLGTYIRGFISW